MAQQLLNPYELLGVTIESSPSDVRRAFYELAKIMHPDKGGTSIDMDALYKAYCYVHQQVVSVNRDATVDTLQEEFDNFCKLQKDSPPPFIDIHNDWAEEFSKAWSHTTPRWNSSEQVGYGDLMAPSEYQNDASVQPVPFADTEAIPVEHTFGQQLVQYTEPLAFGCFGDDTFTQQTENGGMMSDYREAFLDAPSNMHDNVTERQLTDEALQDLLYDRKLLQDSLQQETPQRVTLAFPPDSPQYATAYIQV